MLTEEILSVHGIECADYVRRVGPCDYDRARTFDIPLAWPHLSIPRCGNSIPIFRISSACTTPRELVNDPQDYVAYDNLQVIPAGCAPPPIK
ncbi:MAG: hypothetical protein ABIP89_09475 [Polyangiaceae bacterium]